MEKSYHLLGGIDEAGYGPTLGPLVTSCFSLSSSAPINHTDIPKLLDGIISAKSTRRKKPPRALFIADSKKVHAQSFAELERGTLALLGCCLPADAFLSDLSLLNALYPNISLAEIPWYVGEPSPLPLEADAQDIKTQTAELQNLLKSHKLTFNINSHLITAHKFNSEISDTKNKADLLAEYVMSLASILVTAKDNAHLIIDRLGGRAYYAPILASAFASFDINEILRTPKLSQYTLNRNLIEFACNAESKSLLVAAASLVSKYVREILMKRFNAFFSQHIPELHPTKGYPQDAIRFLTETKDLRERLDIRDEDLIRSR